jgi:hypothetical protein
MPVKFISLNRFIPSWPTSRSFQLMAAAAKTTRNIVSKTKVVLAVVVMATALAIHER